MRIEIEQRVSGTVKERYYLLQIGSQLYEN